MFDTLELYIRIIKKYGTLSNFADAVRCSASFVQSYIDGHAILDTDTMDTWIEALEIPDTEIDSLFFIKKEQAAGITERKLIFDHSKLKSEIYENFDSLKDFAECLNESETSVYNRLNNVTQLTLDDIEKWSEVLELTAEQINECFFDYSERRC